MSQILYPVESPQQDHLEALLQEFHFPIRGFGSWQQESRPAGVEGYICDHQITYIARGALRFSFRGRPFFCPAGTLLLFEPFEVYSTEVLPGGEELECYSIHFDISPEHRQKEFIQALLGNGENVFLPGELPSVQGLFQNLFESRRRQEPGLSMQAGLDLHLIFLYMLRARWSEEKVLFIRPSFVREAELVRRGIEYIHTHIATPIRLSQLGRSLGISSNYLYKCFVNVLGLSPSRYVLQYKIRSSIDLMVSDGCTMEEIAERLGFSSPYHFSASFKQIMGCSPRHYIQGISRGAL